MTFIDSFKSIYNLKFDKNYEKYSTYLNHDFKVFSELKPVFGEICFCLIYDFHKAAITLSNYTLERLLKLALVFNDVGVNPIHPTKWNETFKPLELKYGNKDLGTTIKVCKSKGLITKEECSHIDKNIREQMRNGFSHADYSKILKGESDKVKVYHGSFSSPGKLDEISLNQKTIPFIQSMKIEHFAPETSHPYFKFIFELAEKIEDRLEKNTTLPSA